MLLHTPSVLNVTRVQGTGRILQAGTAVWRELHTTKSLSHVLVEYITDSTRTASQPGPRNQINHLPRISRSPSLPSHNKLEARSAQLFVLKCAAWHGSTAAPQQQQRKTRRRAASPSGAWRAGFSCSHSSL